ncbi:MAG: hypothetical protein IJL96_09475 [Clostridia bacterium]|jgi:hypothetical protein|nr:hypothetical protein [Clostridia bacterium]MBR0217139.1 hypothetical protein [Clostridia bacterium]
MEKQSKNITPIDIVGECNYSIRIRTRGGSEDEPHFGYWKSFLHVLSNADLPGMEYGWVIRLRIFMPPYDESLTFQRVYNAICPGVMEFPGFLMC